MRRRIALCSLALTFPLSAALPGRAATVDITMSNFRYCRAEQCLPIEINYVRNPTGNGLIHKNALAATLIFRTEVNPGDTVVWTYKDSFCDMLDGCTGHAVCFENGTAEGDCGNRFAASQSGATSFSFTVPATAKTGTLLRYFCNVNAHYLFGMTGALLVK